MNQEKIGKFISLNRKKVDLTQEELAEKLGVSKNAVSKWERGICLMDMSLLKPLSEILHVSVNEILQGEYLKDDIKEKSEENILNTIDYSNDRLKKNNKSLGIIIIILGIIIVITALTIFKSESSWGSVYCILGSIVLLVGISKLTKEFNYIKRLLFNIGSFIMILTILIIVDYLSVITLHEAPRFSFSKEYYDNLIIYRASFYQVYQINPDTDNEYFIIDTKNNYDKDTIPLSPFNRNQKGIKELIKYQNDLNGLINHLPLSEYLYNYGVSDNKLIINYQYNKYLNKRFYMERSIIYNTVSLFSLIDDISQINYHIMNKTFTIKRELVEKLYPNYSAIANKYLNRETTFNMYLEKDINSDDYVNYYFKLFFIDEKLKDTKKIVCYGSNKKVITNLNEINKILEIIKKGRHLPYNAIVTSESHSNEIMFYDQNNDLIMKFLVFRIGSFGEDGKEYSLDTKTSEDLFKLIS